MNTLLIIQVDGSWHDGRLNGPSKIDYGTFAYHGKFTENVASFLSDFVFTLYILIKGKIYKD